MQVTAKKSTVRYYIQTCDKGGDRTAILKFS